MEFVDVSNVVFEVYGLNICHLTYDMRIGGTEKVIENLVLVQRPELKQRILCLQPKLGAFGTQLKQQGVPIDCLTWESGFSINIILAIRQFCSKHNIDILHCHQYTPWSYGALACLGFLKTKVIFTEHGRFYPDVSNQKRRFINPVLAALTSGFTSISEATRNALHRFEFLNRDKIHVIYNGIADNALTMQKHVDVELPDDALVFGTVARFDPIKNHPLMVKAFSRVLEQCPKATLMLVGDGETRNELDSLVSSLGIQDKVLFTGYQSEPEVYCQLIDVFLLTSFSEGTSMTLIDALRMGKPAIVTNVGGNPEIVSHRQNGFVIQNDNEDELVDAMIELAAPDLRTHLGERARATYLHRFTAQKMQDEYCALYAQVTD